MRYLLNILFGIIWILAIIILPTLKIAGVLDWSWWWVTSPVWIAVCLSLIAHIGRKIWYHRFIARRKRAYTEK